MRDSRRRRMMLRDEQDSVLSETETRDSGSPENSEHATPAYTAGARVENQPKLIDFVPTRLFTVIGLFLMLVAVVAMLNIAHFQILPFANSKGISAGSLELTLDQGLLSWVASFLLLATAFFCFQVFQVRRFRADDFSGSYRVWIWLAIGFVIASLDATARVSPIIASLISSNWESGFLSVDRNVWLALVGLPAATVALRLIIEIWRSRVAIGSISIAVLAYVVANIVRLEIIPVSEQSHAVVEGNSVIIAHSFLFFTIVTYARFVVLESQGKIRINQEDALPESSNATDVSEGKSQRSENKSASQGSAPENGNVNGKSKKATTARKNKRSNSEDQSATDSNAAGEADDQDTDETPTLKLMGQTVAGKRSNRKKKNVSQNRRRAA